MTITCETVSFSLEVMLVSVISLVTTTVTVIRGSATELRLLPNTVTFVPPLYTAENIEVENFIEMGL